MVLWPGLPGQVSTKRNIHSLTPILIINHPLSTSSYLFNLCTSVFLYHLSPGRPWSTSWSGTLHFMLYTFLHPIIHCLLFATLAHTITTCSTVVPRLCHLLLVSLSTLLGTLSSTIMSHIIWPFSSLPAEVPPHFLFLQASSHIGASMQHTTLHTTIVQSPSHNQWYIHIAWIYSIQFKLWSPKLHQHLHPHSTCHLNRKTYPLTPYLH